LALTNGFFFPWQIGPHRPDRAEPVDFLVGSGFRFLAGVPGFWRRLDRFNARPSWPAVTTVVSCHLFLAALIWKESLSGFSPGGLAVLGLFCTVVARDTSRTNVDASNNRGHTLYNFRTQHIGRSNRGDFCPAKFTPFGADTKNRYTP